MNLEKAAMKFTGWVGTPTSLIAHTFIFLLFLIMIPLGFNPEKVLLLLTTWLSLEAIYLSIFIQMTINHNTNVLKNVRKDVEEIQEELLDVIEEDIK
jgi:hypothetical protein